MLKQARAVNEDHLVMARQWETRTGATLVTARGRVLKADAKRLRER